MCKYKFRRQFLQTAVPLLLTVSMMLTGCGQTGNSDSLVRPILPITARIPPRFLPGKSFRSRNDRCRG